MVRTDPGEVPRPHKAQPIILTSANLTPRYTTFRQYDGRCPLFYAYDVIIVPAVSNEEAEKLFDRGFTQIKPYLRTTPQPNL